MYKSVGTTHTWTGETNFLVVLDEVLQGQQEQECLTGQIFRFKELQPLGS